MDLAWTLPYDTLERAAFLLSRVGGFLLLAPVFSQRPMPRPMRAVLAAMLSVALWPAAAAAAPAPRGLVAGIAAEVALGAAMGLVADFLFAAVEVASALVSFGTGMSYINLVDPQSPVRSTTIATLQWALATALFLALDGHHLLVHALAASFTLVPPGAAVSSGLWPAIAQASGAILGFGLVLAAPALVVLLLADLAIGLVGRVAPQVPALLIGMALKPVAGLLALAVAYGALPRAFVLSIDRMALDLGRLVQAASP